MKICVVGSGSWGTALAKVSADAGHDVCILCRKEDVASFINANHKNPDYLSDSVLPDSVSASADPSVAFDNASACLFVTPSKYLRSMAESICAFVSSDLPNFFF